MGALKCCLPSLLKSLLMPVSLQNACGTSLVIQVERVTIPRLLLELFYKVQAQIIPFFPFCHIYLKIEWFSAEESQETFGKV